MIKPTIGRVVWYTYPVGNNDELPQSQPLAALITYIHSDRMVNLAVFNQAGENFPVMSVTLLQDDDARLEGGRFAEWMSYQVGQAKKHEGNS